MRINNNLMAMNTHRQLGINSNQGAKSIEKLSSGLRINRAGDDAAGLAISEKMRAQVRGLGQASRNAQDAISLVQTAEGALNESQAILQRMRELAVQSANDTNVTLDRDAIQNEVNQLTQEVDRIADTTEFNTRKLLNGGAGLQTTFTSETVAGVASDWMSVSGGSADTQIGAVSITQATKATAATSTITAIDASAGSFNVNGYSMTLVDAGLAADNATAIAALINGNSDAIGATATVAGAAVTITNTAVGSNSNLVINAGANTLTVAAIATDAYGADATVTAAAGITSYVATGNTISVTAGTYEGMVLQFKGSAMSTTANQNLAAFSITANGVLSMQIGANEGQDMNVSIGDMRAAALGVSAIDVSTAANAKSSITTINDALTAVSTERAKMGAVQNRLEHTTKNLDTSAENLQASESRIRDVDMAKEMMNFTKNNILSQAAQAMLAQANQAPQGVLQLLR